MAERVAQLVGRERLQQIVLDAAGDEVAIEAHVIDLPGGDHDRAGLADLGESVDVVQRVARFRQIDEQDVRAGGDGQRLDRIAQAAFVDLFGRPAVLDRDRAEHVGCRIVADVGGERVARSGASVEGSVHVNCPSMC